MKLDETMEQASNLPASTQTEGLLQEFYLRFNQYVILVQAAISAPTDSTVLKRLGDDINQFVQLVLEV